MTAPSWPPERFDDDLSALNDLFEEVIATGSETALLGLGGRLCPSTSAWLIREMGASYREAILGRTKVVPPGYGDALRRVIVRESAAIQPLLDVGMVAISATGDGPLSAAVGALDGLSPYARSRAIWCRMRGQWSDEAWTIIAGPTTLREEKARGV